MSGNDFFGRPITKDTENIEFDLCEICQRKSPNWLQIQYQNNTSVIRFSCNECHEEYINSDQFEDDSTTRQIDDEDEIPERTRPGWIDEFINEGGTTIDTIDTIPVSETKEINAEEETEQKIEFSEAPSTFQETPVQPINNTNNEIKQIAPWAPKFIQEALFGPNPEDWLLEQGAYEKDNLDITLQTLGSFSDNDVNSVKLSAIQCLLGLYNRVKSYGDNVIGQLRNYENDEDEVVADFASQTIKQIS